MQAPTEHIFRLTCVHCERPAVTLDAEDSPLCPRHSDVIVASQHDDRLKDEDW